ncbi:MAG: SDR family NAD(P)-dependent oxidoreductase [Rhizobiales bacterium]|nr:SDR family NAD(P)-dependent oxidoreductase [Hyphomicrobiales bacterium]
MSERLDGRIALVTGASRGIGRAVALALAKSGAHVVALARTRGALEELDDEIRTATGQSATLVTLNLRNAEMVNALGPTLYQRWGRLDILVANAAVLGPISPLDHISDTDWMETLETNVTASWRLIRTLDPLLKRSPAGRVVMVTSGAVDRCPAFWGPYSVSKAALEALARTYAAEVANTAIRVNLLNPGPIATRMRAKAFPGEDPATLPAPEAVAPLFLELASSTCTSNGKRYDFKPH